MHLFHLKMVMLETVLLCLHQAVPALQLAILATSLVACQAAIREPLF
jgi:hypothetical protein